MAGAPVSSWHHGNLRLSAFSGSTHTSITQLQHTLSIFPRFDPRRFKSMAFLASQRYLRYTRLHQKEDLDKAIVQFTELILLSPLSWLQHDILTPLFLLANTLFLRSKVSKHPEDTICATNYFSHLRDQPHEIPRIPRYKVTELLVEALALQVEFEAGNVMQNIREMVILSRELLETPNVDATPVIILIHAVVKSKIRSTLPPPGQPLDEIIEFSRAARKRRPDLLEGHMTFALSLLFRYVITGTCANRDYEEAVSVLDNIIASTGNSQDEFVTKARATATLLVTNLAVARSMYHQTPENLEEAIYRTRTCVSSPSVNKHFHAPSIFRDPKDTAKFRFLHFGPIEGVEESSDNSLANLNGAPQEYTQTISRMEDLLFKIRNTKDTTEIDEAVEKARYILVTLTLSPDFKACLLKFFDHLLDAAFTRTKKIAYLNESISVCRQLIESPFLQPFRISIFSELSRSLLVRSHYFPGYCTEDLDEAVELMSQYVSSAHASVPNRFESACWWAIFARDTRHTSVSTAYETAMSLMQDTVLFSPTLQLQHATLAKHNYIQSLPLDYASYQVDQNQLVEAIETLERGRALLWSEMRHLRAPIDQLHPDLGARFAAVNRNLEKLTKSVPPSHKLSMDDAAPDGLRAVDPFGRLLLEQRGLLEERAKLISQIQALPGFDTFLTSPSFDTLRSVASAESEAVVIINHSEWRCDILILLHNKLPSLISTPRNLFERAGALKDKLLNSRPKPGEDDWCHYNEVLASVLAELYTLVGQPVIDRLRQLQVPEQSRIWWCPTSVFCSLPLHAMGPIPSNNEKQRYFLDLYICSYTPTLSALIQSRRRYSGSPSSDRPPILVVAQPDPSLPTVRGEIQAVQALDTEVTSLISDAATPDTVIDAFHHHRFVHFACHGTLEAGKPFEAGFELHGEARLTLLEIVRANLPGAEFAFLAACHTAEVTEGSIVDEGLHLAAAVQYCGFRSVVGTMWAMQDEDGPDLAKNFYKVLLRQDQGVPYHERSAEALQYAVKLLRRKRYITLERWVNFVHYGA